MSHIGCILGQYIMHVFKAIYKFTDFLSNKIILHNITLNLSLITFFTLLWMGIIDYNLSIVSHIIIDNNVTQLVVVDSAKPCISQTYSKLSSTHHCTSY